MSPHAKRRLVLLALILCAAAFLRLYGLRVGFPFEVYVDETYIVRPVLEMYRAGSFRPVGFYYPSLVYYLLLAAAYLIGLFKEPVAFDLYVVGRTFSAVFSTATVLVVYLTGRRAYDEATGLLAAAFLAFTVTAFREAHFYTTDSLNTFFIALAVYFIVKISLGDGAKNYVWAGVAAGLAAGSKYNGAFLVVPLLFAHLAGGGGAREREGYAYSLKSLARALFSPRLVAAGVVALVTFCLTTPYAIVEPAEFFGQLSRSGSALSREVVDGNHHYIGTPPYWYYVENLLFWAMNPLLEAACLAGLVHALARRRRPDIVIALWVVIYFAVVGGWLNKVTRYTLPLLPFLCLFGARTFVEAVRHFRARGRRELAAVFAAGTCLTLASAVLYSLAYAGIFARPHTGAEAVRWVYENVPAGATVLLEEPTPQERPQPDAARTVYDDPAFDPGRRRLIFRPLWVTKLSRREDDREGQQRELDAALDEGDYIVMSTRWYEGYVDSPEASPVIREHYRSLRDGTGRFELVKEFTSRPRLFGVEIDDDRSELNFRLFDHPKVWIFRKKPGM